jgi:hypothetical protein
MPDKLDAYSFNFADMETDELEFALGRYRERSNVEHRAWRRLWWRNVGLGAVAYVSCAIGALALWRGLAGVFSTGVATVAVEAFSFVALWGLWTSHRWNRHVRRWAEETRQSRNEYESAVESATWAARLLAERSAAGKPHSDKALGSSGFGVGKY